MGIGELFLVTLLLVNCKSAPEIKSIDDLDVDIDETFVPPSFEIKSKKQLGQEDLVEKVEPKVEIVEDVADSSAKPLVSEVVEKPETIAPQETVASLEAVALPETTKPSDAGAPISCENSPIKRGIDVDGLSAFLAGVDEDFSAYNKLKSPEWDSFRKNFEALKAHYTKKNIEPMVKWRDENLQALQDVDKVLFYPFSGPDVVNMLSLFPRHKYYVMMGLEKVGDKETLDFWTSDINKRKLEMLEKAVRSVFERSFFRTLDMSSDFSHLGTKGVTPAMMMFLRSQGYYVLGLQWVSLSKEGSIKYLTDQESIKKHTNYGVEFTVRHPDLSYEQKIYYFKSDVGVALANNQPMQKFIGTLKDATTFVKSASFLMHMREFSLFREKLLAMSGRILQDDSGVPYKFVKKDWTSTFFGKYTGPYGESFAKFPQPDLVAAYKEQEYKPLDFFIGYGFALVPPHLMLFVRK